MSEKPSRITIANCSERAAKILRLALDPAAADGEQQAAACLFVAALRKCGATIETDAAPLHPPPRGRRSPSECHSENTKGRASLTSRATISNGSPALRRIFARHCAEQSPRSLKGGVTSDDARHRHGRVTGTL